MLEKNYPELVTAKIAKELRKGKVFINWSQNDSSLTMVSVYSLRARQKPVVSFPLAWHELEILKAGGEPEMFQIGPEEALRRTENKGDLFHELPTVKQKLPYL
jgi:bifunctional non-homologous end joining protein LigD